MTNEQFIILIENGIPTGYPISYTNLKYLHPTVSFPPTVTQSVLDEYGYARYVYTSAPTPPPFHTVHPSTELSWDAERNAFTNGWTILPFTQEELDLYKAGVLAGIRKKRTLKLYESDWTQLPDAPLTEELREAWKIYRQALRDYPSLVEQVESPDDAPAFPTHPDK